MITPADVMEFAKRLLLAYGRVWDDEDLGIWSQDLFDMLVQEGISNANQLEEIYKTILNHEKKYLPNIGRIQEYAGMVIVSSKPQIPEQTKALEHKDAPNMAPKPKNKHWIKRLLILLGEPDQNRRKKGMRELLHEIEKYFADS